MWKCALANGQGPYVTLCGLFVYSGLPTRTRGRLRRPGVQSLATSAGLIGVFYGSFLVIVSRQCVCVLVRGSTWPKGFNCFPGVSSVEPVCPRRRLL